MSEKIAAIEMDGRIGAAWKKVSNGLQELSTIYDEVAEPKQSDLFPLDVSGVVDSLQIVICETKRLVKRLATRVSTSA